MQRMHIREENEKINMVKRLTCLMLSKTIENKLSVEFIYCACGCGLTKPKYDNWKRISKFIRGHGFSGKHHTKETRKRWSKIRTGRQISQETKNKMSLVRKGINSNEKHYLWKGDDVGYFALHTWIRKKLPSTKSCQICLLKPPYDCACITGVYNRELKNWARLCKSCHKILDNRKKQI